MRAMTFYRWSHGFFIALYGFGITFEIDRPIMLLESVGRQRVIRIGRLAFVFFRHKKL